MKFKCGPTLQEKINARKDWHEWFAWYPVTLDGSDCRWLETVERRGNHNFKGLYRESYWDYEYRVKGDQK